MSTLHVVVLGAGPGGYVAALRAAQLGAKVTVVEQRELGGVCLNRGCIPTKSLLASVNALRAARETAKYGVDATDVRPNFGRMMERKDNIVANLRKGIASLFRKNRVGLVRGTARLRSPRDIEVTTEKGGKEVLVADRVVVATGSSPAGVPFAVTGTAVYSPLEKGVRGLSPQSLGQDVNTPLSPPASGGRVQLDRGEFPLLTSDECLELREVPASMLVVGGGAVGVELAYIFSQLGSAVTIVEMMPRLISAEDGEVAEEFARGLRRASIRVLTGKRVETAEQVERGSVHVWLSGGDELTVAAILAAVGRRPNTVGLSLDSAGVRADAQGRILTNERMETSAPGVYAVGDVVGGMLLAHKASAEGVVAAENALGGASRMDYGAIPRCMFTEPQVASVGLTEEDAKGRGLRCGVGRFPFRALGKAHAAQKTAGFVKVLADEASGRLLGVHMLGDGVSEIIHEAALAVRLGLKAAELHATIHAHPTMSEAIGEAALGIEGRALHI